MRTMLEIQRADLARRAELARDRLARRGLLPWVASVCERRGELLEDVIGGARRRRVVLLRRELLGVLGDTLVIGASELGHLFAIDHTTVIHARREHWAALEAAS